MVFRLLVLFCGLIGCAAFAGDSCPDQRPAAAANVPACKGLKTCIAKGRIDSLKGSYEFPRYADALAKFKDSDCEGSRNDQMHQVVHFQLGLNEKSFPRETKIAVDLITKLKSRVDETLQQSKDRINWVNKCVDALAQSEVYNDHDGTFNAKATTANYSKQSSDSSCTALWEDRSGQPSVLTTLQAELKKERLYLALSMDWENPANKQLLNPLPKTSPGEFFKDVPRSMEPLSGDEKAELPGTRASLFHDCIAEGSSPCLGSKELQIYAQKRYRQEVSDNPILVYFTRSTDSRWPVTGKELASAYQSQRAKMDKLGQAHLNDQDYLNFSYFLNDALNEIPLDQRGDYCEVAQAMLDNSKAKKNFYKGLSYLGYYAGGAGAAAAKGVILPVMALIFSSSYSVDVYTLSEYLSESAILKKIESTCASSALQARGVCDVEAIATHTDTIAVDWATLKVSGSISALGALSSLGLYGAAANLLIGK